MIYYIKATILIIRGARYFRGCSLRKTLAVVAARRCRLHWLRTSMAEG